MTVTSKQFNVQNSVLFVHFIKGVLTMKTITSTEARQNFSSVISTVETDPVTILKQDKDVAVIISSARYKELKKLEDILYGKAAELAIKEGFAADNEIQDLLDNI